MHLEKSALDQQIATMKMRVLQIFVEIIVNLSNKWKNKVLKIVNYVDLL